jgi:hypothetical protein
MGQAQNVVYTIGHWKLGSPIEIHTIGNWDDERDWVLEEALSDGNWSRISILAPLIDEVF